MASYNKVLLMGNLTRDPQLKYLPSQTTVVDFSAFGRTAEVINQYFTKGKPIFIEGRLRFEQWEDKQGGGKRSRLSVTVENFQFIGGRDGGPPGEEGPRPARGPARPVPPGTPSNAPPSSGPEQPFPDEAQFK